MLPQNTQTTSTTTQTQAEEFRKMIEVEVLKIIKDLAEKGQTPKERIQELAQLALDLIKPGMNLEELYGNAVKLDDRHSELAPVVFKVMKEYEEVHEKKALTHVNQLIKSGHYDKAQDMVKKVLKFKELN